jgi:hypothetical protein
MDKNPKETSRTRKTLGGGTKTVTKSKSMDAAGTKIKTRTVSRDVPSDAGVSSVKKTTTKRKFASGQTSKRKVESVDRKNSGFGKTTTVKEKVSGPGVANKAKGLVTKSDKYAYKGTGSEAKSMNYKSAKGVQSLVKKGYDNMGGMVGQIVAAKPRTKNK